MRPIVAQAQRRPDTFTRLRLKQDGKRSDWEYPFAAGGGCMFFFWGGGGVCMVEGLFGEVGPMALTQPMPYYNAGFNRSHERTTRAGLNATFYATFMLTLPEGGLRACRNRLRYPLRMQTRLEPRRTTLAGLNVMKLEVITTHEKHMNTHTKNRNHMSARPSQA
jgi:hypothetical protein